MKVWIAPVKIRYPTRRYAPGSEDDTAIIYETVPWNLSREVFDKEFDKWKLERYRQWLERNR